MLNVFRENLRHLKWILLLVVFSFILTIYAVWGGGVSQNDSSPDGAQSWAARVDGEVISIQDFQTEARNLDASYRQLLGAQYDQQRAFLRVGQTAIDRLINESLLEKEAKRAALSVTEQEVANAIIKDPSLQQNGAFIGRERYEKLYQSNPVMFESYEAAVRRQVLQNKLRSLLEDSVTVSEAELEDAYRRQNEKAAFDYLVLDSSKLPADQPSASAIENYYQTHLADYQSGEGRSGRYVLFNTKDIAAGIDVPESEIRSQFLQDQKTVYSTPEKRRASHILIKVSSDASTAQVKAAEDKAQKVLKRVRSGEDFAKVAKEVSEDSTASSGGDLGYFTRDQMVREFADATWALKVGQISDPVRSPFGFHVILLTDMQAARELTLEEARPQILASLKEARSRDEAQRRASEFAAKLKSAGDDFAKAARDSAVVPKEFKGVHPGEPFPDLGLQPAVTAGLFALKIGDAGTPVTVGTGVVVVQFLEVTPGAALPLEKVRDRVAADALRQMRVEAARRILDTAGGGSDLAAVAKRLKLEVKKTGPIPQTGPAGELGADAVVLREIFSLKIGETSPPLALPSGSVAVVKMVDRPDPMQGFAAQKASLRNNLLYTKRDRLFRAYVDRLRAEHPAEINAALVEQIDRS
ncbi:MAG: peptidylprolyl isomerase [Acidobacteria bacterium]|nr:peptidylprolyl isomerase [Acidobacteriota bacterium]